MVAFWLSPNAKIEARSPRQQRYNWNIQQWHIFTVFGCVFEMKCFGYVIVLQATAITNTTNWKKKKKYHKNCSSKRIAISACQINCVSPPKMAHYFWVRGKRIQCRLQCTNKKIQIHYPSNSVTICSSFSSAPTTLNLRRLHTCGFSYLPNLIFVTIAGWCSFSVINCGGELLFDDHRDAWLLGQSSRILL